jgi:lipid II:glycine glycyltransferase (peptidoglycan interpeptide bridge formation enzyme)
MLTIKLSLQRTKAVQAAHIWFAAKPKPADALNLAYYYHCQFTGPVKGFERHAKFTKLVNVDRTDEAIQKDFRKNTQYEVRRAQKEGLAFSVLDNAEVFREFYDGFAATKDMERMDPKILRAYWPHLAVTQMTNAAEVLVMHCYVMDKSSGRATLWHSASQFRGADGEDAQQRRNLIGRANRLLHFRDMTWLRDQGFKTYDFGGYAAGTTDPALQHINEFKDSFGGELVEESNYASAAIRLLRRVKSALKLRRVKPNPSAP